MSISRHSNSLIPGARRALKNCLTEEEDVVAERDRVMPVLRKAQYIDVQTYRSIKSSYEERLSYIRQDIDELRAYLFGLEARS